MDNLKEVLDIVTKMGFIPFLIPIIYFMINNFNITDIEKKLLTNFQKLQIFFANILISFVFGSISMGFPLYNEIVKGNDTKLFFLIIGLISLSVSIYIYISIFLFEKFLPISSKMLVNYGDKEWMILRVISKSQVVLSRKGREDDGCQGIVIYRELKSVKEKDIKIYYELKKDNYSIFIRNISMKRTIYVIISDIIFFFAFIVMWILVLKYLNDFNAMGLVSIFIMTLILLTNGHIFYLKKVNKLHPEILAGSND